MLMTTLKKKLNKKGFTLAELLIVVAIIAILVAISIPIFTGKLEDARVSTDQANMRAAKAAAVTEYLNEQEIAADKVYYYNAETGMLQEDNSGIKAYGKSNGDTVKGDDDTTPQGNIIKITISKADGSTQISWVAPGV